MHRKDPKPPARVPPGLAVMADEIESLPFGVAGERLPVVKPEPAPVPPAPFVIEPPPWREGGVDLALPASTGPERPDALAAMKTEDGEDDWAQPAGPPVEYEPLLPVAIPPPDWREIEAEHQRQKAAEAQQALELEPTPYPARPSRQKAPRWP